MAAKLKLNPTYVRNKSVSDKISKTAAEMFTYLNFCPNKLQYFPKHLFHSGTPKEIILAMTSIMKTSQNAAKEAATEIITLTMESLGLNHFEEIQMITKGKCLPNLIF